MPGPHRPEAAEGMVSTTSARTRSAGCGESPASPHGSRVSPSPESDASASRTTLEVLADQELERAEVALGQVLEAPPARGQRGLDGIESLDGSQQMLVVFGELQLHGAAERRVAGQLQRRLPPIAAGLDERAEGQALEPLRHGAPVPPEGSRRRLHVEPVLARWGARLLAATTRTSTAVARVAPTR